MNFIALLPVLTELVGRIFPDKEKAAEAANEMQKILSAADAERYKAEATKNEAKKEIITTEIKSSWAGNWRAYLMLVCVAIIAYNWIIVSFLNAFLGLLGIQIVALGVPTELWTLVTVGLGGYIGEKTMQTYSEAKYGPANDKKFYDVLRQKLFTSGMSKEQVDVFNEALKARGE